MQKFRVYTDIGKDQKLTVELNQDFDLLEILSLKFSQQQIYSSFCADYGVVVGRITANNGYGVPNARVSIFVPLATEDENDPVISSLYPFKSIDQKNEEGYRYNLLPSRKQHGGHVPTGTFPDQLDIIGREEVLEVFEKYYKYTVKTNSSGDFMIWGVPPGPQNLHIDVDLSDMGCFSLRPDDFIRLGYGVDQFETAYSFKSSNDLDSLPQIVSFRKTIEVYPFWGNEDLCQIGISRSDFDLSDAGINIQPFAYMIGGTFTDSGKNTINKNCKPRRKMGRKCNLTTQLGTIETIRFTTKKDTNNLPILETLPSYEDIEEDGSFLFPIEMNMDYLITNEFGENEYSNDPNKGIPTSSVCRFRFSLKDDNLSRVRTVAKYLVPNIKEYTNDRLRSYAWSLNFSDYPSQAINGITRTIDGFYYPEDYFYRLTYNKVYTVSSFQNSHFKDAFFPKDDFLAIKEIVPAEEEDCTDSVNTFPVNFGIRNYTFNLLIAEVLLFVEHLLNVVTLVFMNTVARTLIRVGCAIDSKPIRNVAGKLKEFGFAVMESSQKKLYLINYPECDECVDNELSATPNDNTGAAGPVGVNCSVGTLSLNAPNYFDSILYFNKTDISFSNSNAGDCSSCSDPLKNIDGVRRSNQYFSSGVTNLAIFILSQSHYMLDETPGDGTYNLFDQNTYGPVITGTPVYHKCYTYDFSAYVGVTDLDLVYNGVSYDIPDPISSSDFFNNFPANSFGPSGATLTITSSSTFTVCPNSTKTFGGLTVTHSIGTDTVLPTIVENTNIIIDYDNPYFINTSAEIYGPISLVFDIRYRYSDTTGGTIANCYEVTPPPAVTVPVEAGCEIYDTPYNEEIASWYITVDGNTTNPEVNGFAEYWSITDEAQRGYAPAGGRAGCTSIYGTIISDITSNTGDCDSTKNDDVKYFFNSSRQRVYPLHKWYNGNYQIKQTISGVSEFKNGVFYIVPGSLTNSRLLKILREYRVRKRVGKLFCGGIVNYSFMDNWLSGSLYFFPFKAKFKRGGARIKYCTTLIRYNTNDGEFYYRSCPYDPATNTYGSPITIVGKGSNINNKIHHPTTIVDLGPRDEFIKEICVDPALDPNCSVSRAIGPSSYQNFGEILGLAINYKLDTFNWPSNPLFNLDSFFKNDGFENVGGLKRVLNGDILQLISINNEVGISEFDLQSPKYLAYSYQFLDPECYPNVFKNGTSVWGPTPITMDMEEDGVRQRLCLNQPTHTDYDGRLVQGRLTESSQVVPFYLWDKKGPGFGPYNNSTKDDQAWDYSNVEVQPLQGMTYAYNISGVPNVAADRYLLLPMTYTFSGISLTTGGNVTNEIAFEAISVNEEHANYNDQYPGFQFLFITGGTLQNPSAGVLYTRYGSAGNNGVTGWNVQSWTANDDAIVKRTENYYTGNKQILSTPFLFYFGLRPGKTGLDKLIEKFGPTGAFVNQD